MAQPNAVETSSQHKHGVSAAGLELDRRPSKERPHNTLPESSKAYEAGILRTKMGPPPIPRTSRVIAEYVHHEPLPRFDKAGLEITEQHMPDHVSDEKKDIEGQRSARNKIRRNIVLVLVFVAIMVAILVGILVTRRAMLKSKSPEPDPVIPVPTASAQQINDQLPGEYVKVDSPLVAHAFIDGTEDERFSPGPNIWLYYQTNKGDIQLMMKGGQSDWRRRSDPIFTDAMNNTGLATWAHKNGTAYQPSVFYVGGQNSLLREKRYFQEDSGEKFVEGRNTLGRKRYSVAGNDTIGEPDPDMPMNGWGPLRMAAVYATNVTIGPEGMVYYHRRNEAGDWVIQEVIWNQRGDTWTPRSLIPGALPGARMSAVVEPSSLHTRLFYTAPGNTLAEARLNLRSDPEVTYEPGLKFPGLLMNPSADFVAVSTSKGTLIYFASYVEETSKVTIHELSLPDAENDPETPPSPTVVTTCGLMAKNTGSQLPSLYAPIGAVVVPAHGKFKEEVHVFWTEDAEDQQSGYGRIMTLSRRIDEQWDDSVEIALPVL